MSYNKRIWANGDLITKERMNNIENGIYDAHDKINAINNKVEENTTDTNTARQDISDIKLQIGTEELTTTSKKIKGAINDLSSQIKEKANKADLEVEKARIDLLTKIESGQTDGNAELLDIRIDNEGFVHETSGNAIRHQINKIVDTMEILPNLINHATSKVGFMELDGNVDVSLSNMRYTELTKVIPGRTIYFGSTNLNYGYAKKIIAYSDINTIVESKGGTDLLTWTVPEGINYIRFCYDSEKFINLTAKYDSIGDTSDYEYGYNIKYEKLNSKAKKIIENSKLITDKIDIKNNLFDKSKITVDKAINNNGILYDASGAFTSDFIDLAGDVNFSIVNIRYLVYFDKDDNVISYYSNDDSTYKNLTSPENCSKVRFFGNIRDLDADTVTLIEDNEIPYNYNTNAKISGNRVVFADELDKKISKPINPWAGTKWCSYGDSITEFDKEWNWQNLVTKYLGMGTHYNRGVGGSEVSYYPDFTFEFEGNTLPRGMCMWERIKTIPQDVGMIFFMGGTNNVGRYGGTPIGDLTFDENNTVDSSWLQYCIDNGLRVGDFNIETYKGGIASTIMKLQVWCPNALIILGTQLSGAVLASDMEATEYYKNSLGLSPVDYANYTKEVANYMSKPLVDMFGECGINLFNRTKYITDTVHPFTEAGQKAMARVVISHLKNQLPLL